jgi:hypothetical protein
MSTEIIERGTLYRGNGFGYQQIEGRQISCRIGPSAQFTQAIHLTFTHKGHRKSSNQILVGGQLVILAGWGHPAPPDDWLEGTPLGSIPTDWGKVDATCHHTRYPFGDKRWVTEFNCFLDEHVRRSGASVVLDFRNHDFMAMG